MSSSVSADNRIGTVDDYEVVNVTHGDDIEKTFDSYEQVIRNPVVSYFVTLVRRTYAYLPIGLGRLKLLYIFKLNCSKKI